MAVLADSIDGNGIYAMRAEADKDGNRIDLTYAKLTDIPAAQVQSDWSESDSSAVSYIQNKPSNLVQDASYVHTDENFTSAEKTKLAGIESGAEVNVQSDWAESDSSSDAYIQNKPDLSVYATQTDLASKQDTLTAGSNITIQSNVISATDTTYSAGTGIDITGTTISADTSVLATQSDLSGKQDTLTAGSNIQINGTTISATDTTYSAGTGIDITGTTISADTSVLATQQDLSGKQDVLTAGTNVQINNNVISATDTTYSAGSNIQINGTTISATDTTYTAGTGLSLNGTEFSADTTVLATQSDLSGKQDTLTAGSNISINNNVISATDTTYSAGTGLTLTGTTFSNSDPLPAHTSSESGKILKVDSNGDLEWGAESGGTVTDVQVNGTSVVTGGVADITITAQVNSDWTATSGVAEILHKPTEKTLAAGSNVTITEANDTVTISAADTTYSAGTGIDITTGVISADTTVLATQSDLSNKQDTLTAGTNISITNNTISATDTTYSAGTGLTLTGTTFSNSDPLPAHTSSESGKVLSVDSSGDTVWSTPAASQVNSDWNATSGVAEILNKPTEKTLVAGTNVTLTESASSVTISSTDTTYTAGTGVDITSGVISADTSVLATQSDLSSKQDTLTAGTNITISNNVISAASQVQSDWSETDTTDPSYIENKPDLVDIVAGPGIVVDNPDGNTLRVSMAADYEVELWSGTETATMNLSEPITNFETIKLIGHSTENPGAKLIQLIDSSSTEFMFAITSLYVNSGTNYIVIWASTFSITNNGSSIAYTLKGHTWQGLNGWSNGSHYVVIDKIVGINRTASAQ